MNSTNPNTVKQKITFCSVNKMELSRIIDSRSFARWGQMAVLRVGATWLYW